MCNYVKINLLLSTPWMRTGGSTAPLILDLGNGYMWEAYCISGNNFGIQGISGCVDRRDGLGVLGKKKYILRRPVFALEIEAKGVLIPDVIKTTLDSDPTI